MFDKTPLSASIKLLCVIAAATILWFMYSALVQPVAAAGRRIWFAESGGFMWVANLDGTGNIFPYSGIQVNNAGGIVLDQANNKMYLTNPVSNTVTVGNIDGSLSQVNLGNLNGTLGGPFGIALDLAHGKMYVTNQYSNTVSVANLDGTGGTSLGDLNGTLNSPKGIALDVLNGRMYVANSNNNIVVANLDGTGGQSLGNFDGILSYNCPVGVALDLSHGKMYVTASACNGASHMVARANLDGTGGVNLGNLNGTLVYPQGIALDVPNGKMYVKNGSSSRISVANLDGTGGAYLGTWTTITGGSWRGIAIESDPGPNLTVRKVNNVYGRILIGNSFQWTISVRNEGIGAATFANGQVIFRDNLPPGHSYGTPNIQNAMNITNAANLVCSIAANVLTCTANGSPVTMGSSLSGLNVSLSVTPNAGTLTNPTSGVCRVDPDNVISESYETDNDCSDTVIASDPVPGLKMYVGNPGNYDVVRANLDGSGGTSLGSLGYLDNKPQGAQGVALDPVARRLYALTLHSVVRANLDGSEPTDLGDSPVGEGHLALDLTHSKIYIVSYYDLARANLDGTGYTDLGVPNGDYDDPGGIALDLQNGKMYITSCDFLGASSHISSANLDGTGGIDLGNLNGLLTCSASPGGPSPGGIALDVANNNLYVANGSTILRANLDGTGATSLGNLNGTLNAAEAIALDLANGKMYVTNSGNNTISMANLDGTGGISLGNLNGTLNSPADIALDLTNTTPDLTASKSNDVAGSMILGGNFHWTITTQNAGVVAASFADGQVILRDNLPAGPTYGTPTVQNVTNMTNSGNIACDIGSNILTCTASGAPVALGSSTGKFDVTFAVTPHAAGTLMNPTGGVCRVDPNNVIVESNESNNDCSNAVVVISAPTLNPLFLPYIRK